MRPDLHFAGLMFMIAVMAGCSSDSGDEEAESSEPPAPSFKEPLSETQAVLSKIDGYESWPVLQESAARPQSEAHSNMFVTSYYNETAAAAIEATTLPFPDGSIFVKNNYPSADAAAPMAVTVMSKEAGAWYWIQATPDSQVFVMEGNALEGKSVAMCIGCHKTAEDNDFFMTRTLE